jgi:hypothetical protein
MALNPHDSHPMQVLSKSGNKEGHFTPELKTVFHNYLASLSNGVTQTTHTAFPPLTLRPVHVRLQSGSKEVHFTLEAFTLLLKSVNNEDLCHNIKAL